MREWTRLQTVGYRLCVTDYGLHALPGDVIVRSKYAARSVVYVELRCRCNVSSTQCRVHTTRARDKSKGITGIYAARDVPLDCDGMSQDYL